VKLTTDEIKLVVFILLALLLGAAVKHYRAPKLEIPPRSPTSTLAAPARDAER
jgi:hypothetical protein